MKLLNLLDVAAIAKETFMRWGIKLHRSAFFIHDALNYLLGSCSDSHHYLCIRYAARSDNYKDMKQFFYLCAL